VQCAETHAGLASYPVDRYGQADSTWPQPGRELMGEIRMMNADGTNDVVLVTDIAGADYVGQPTWSRDGKKTADNYHHLVGQLGSEIRVLDLTTQRRRR
jgi:hypothetical protein